VNKGTFWSALGTTAIATTIGMAGAPIAVSDTHTTTLGSQVELVDGAVMQGWTVTDLKPSSDVIPHPVRGTLWEATATDVAITGSATPIVSNFNARARNGDTYRVLFGAATPQGVNPATLAQGQHTTGKLYFDVTGDASPDSVLYNAGGPDLLLWLTPPPAPRGSAGSSEATWMPGTTAGPGGAGASGATTPNVDRGSAPAGQPVGIEGPGGGMPAGSSGTPLPPAGGSQGTPIQTTETPAGTAAVVPPPAGGSQGTPVGTGVPAPGATPTATAPSVPGQPPTPAVAPPGSQGTPASAAPSTTPIAPPPA
jgi:hypothetical protein